MEFSNGHNGKELFCDIEILLLGIFYLYRCTIFKKILSVRSRPVTLYQCCAINMPLSLLVSGIYSTYSRLTAEFSSAAWLVRNLLIHSRTSNYFVPEGHTTFGKSLGGLIVVKQIDWAGSFVYVFPRLGEGLSLFSLFFEKAILHYFKAYTVGFFIFIASKWQKLYSQFSVII